MTQGVHITVEDCRKIRDLRRRGYFAGLIANQLDISESTVYYHSRGRCIHSDDDRPY